MSLFIYLWINLLWIFSANSFSEKFFTDYISSRCQFLQQHEKHVDTRNSWHANVRYGAANPVTNSMTKVRQSCGKVGTIVHRMPTRNSRGALAGRERRGANLPRFRESFECPETSFMNATRNFNRFVRSEICTSRTAMQIAADVANTFKRNMQRNTRCWRWDINTIERSLSGAKNRLRDV